MGDFWGQFEAKDSPHKSTILVTSANAPSYINNGQLPGISAEKNKGPKVPYKIYLSLATNALKLTCEHNWWHHFHYDIPCHLNTSQFILTFPATTIIL